ncbi:hypothetical protein HK096_005745, partial [Nowakowskiella sp. JEL0078]
MLRIGRSLISRRGYSTDSIPNKFSSRVTQVKAQGASQAMLYAVGLTPENIGNAQVGITSIWYEGNPCNMHLMDLAGKVKEGVKNAGLNGFRFNTIGVSDGLSMGTEGMGYSLQSREIIADSIETVMGGQWYDANISIPGILYINKLDHQTKILTKKKKGCDKNMPGCLIAMSRVNRPSIMVYGGTIKPGVSCTNQSLDIVSAFQSYGQYISSAITEEERYDIVRNSCPGPGACGGMYTANTMASAIEAMGMTLPYSSSTPATDPKKIEECLEAGIAIRNLIKNDIKPSDIITRASFENAMVMVMALGGSTNAVLHLIAMAKAAGIKLTIDDFQTVSDRIPFIADLKPSGKYVMEDIHKIGGTPAIMKYLLEQGLLDGNCLTVTGKTIKENLGPLPSLIPGQDVIKPLSNPIKSSGHLQILYGNLAPEGSVAKITGKEGLKFTGPAKVFDGEEDMLKALEDKKIVKGDVVIIRFEGPKGGPGMPEMLTPTSAIVGAGLASDVALLTDGRFSGGSHGFIIGHITPEAQEGGPIALVRNGDIVTIDAETKGIHADVSKEEFAKRKDEWVAPPLKATKGTLYKFIKNVSSASEGCVTDA